MNIVDKVKVSGSREIRIVKTPTRQYVVQECEGSKIRVLRTCYTLQSARMVMNGEML